MNIKKYIPLKIKTRFVYYKASNKKYRSQYKKEDKKIIIALAAYHGNLGDVAITYAQRHFLEENFKEYKVIEVPVDRTYPNMKSLEAIVGKEDIITIIGGGNFGNIYDDVEEARQFFIKKFPENKIICFPQTIDFSKDEKGKKALEKAKKVYGSHKNLTLFAREEKSFKTMEEVFTKNEVYLVPDIVLSLNKQEPKEKREKVTICFRNDKENGIANEKKAEIVEILKNEYKDDILMQDTHVGEVRIDEKERLNYLEKIWTTFRQSKVVVTDRLHGMIFCVITGTPCIAFPNSNGKIEASYHKWLQGTPYIELANNDDILQQIQELVKKNKTTKVKEKKEEYETLLQKLKNNE